MLFYILQKYDVKKPAHFLNILTHNISGHYCYFTVLAPISQVHTAYSRHVDIIEANKTHFEIP